MTLDRLTSDPPPEAQRGVEADPQTQTLRLFTLLTALRPDWAGTFLLSVGLTPAGAALALAANLAGAACLSLDPSPEACRAALRSGSVDFAVNSLDEAVRVLKNEIRQRRPLSVALESEPQATLAEILDRGLLPDLFTAFAAPQADAATTSAVLNAAHAFARQGAIVVDFAGTLGQIPAAVHAATRLPAFLTAHNLHLGTFYLQSALALRSFDARVPAVLPAQDRPRRLWSSAAARHFSRSRAGVYQRSLYLTPAEHDILSDAPAPSIGPDA